MERYYYGIYTDFLLPQTVTALLADTLAMEDRFTPSTVYDSEGMEGVDPRFRISALLLEFGTQREVFQRRLQTCLPAVRAPLGVSPFMLTRMEVEPGGAWRWRILQASHGRPAPRGLSRPASRCA